MDRRRADRRQTDRRQTDRRQSGRTSPCVAELLAGEGEQCRRAEVALRSRLYRTDEPYTFAHHEGPPVNLLTNYRAAAGSTAGRTYLSLIFLRNSGYCVAAPPRTASRGMLNFSVISVMNGFVPGR